MGRRIALVVLAAAVVAGCGGSKTNGEDKKSAQQVVTDARDAANAASIVHVTGGGTDNGQPLKLDLWIGNGRGKGHIEESGLAFDIIRIGNSAYIRGGPAFWKRFGGSSAATLLQGKWVKAPVTNGEVASLVPLTDKKRFFSSLLAQHGTIENKGVTEFKGQKAVEIRDTTQGGSLFVANEGTPYPIGVQGGKNQGDVTFGDWNADEPIAAPKGALDFSSFGK